MLMPHGSGKSMKPLAKLLNRDEDNLSASVFRTISSKNLYNINLVQQRKWL